MHLQMHISSIRRGQIDNILFCPSKHALTACNKQDAQQHTQCFVTKQPAASCMSMEWGFRFGSCFRVYTDRYTVNVIVNVNIHTYTLHIDTQKINEQLHPKCSLLTVWLSISRLRRRHRHRHTSKHHNTCTRSIRIRTCSYLTQTQLVHYTAIHMQTLTQ